MVEKERSHSERRGIGQEWHVGSAVQTNAPDAPGAGGPSVRAPVGAAAGNNARASLAGVRPHAAVQPGDSCGFSECGLLSQVFQGRKQAVLTCQRIISLV